MSLPLDQIEAVLDALAQPGADPFTVEAELGIKADFVRELLDDPEVARRALRRKRGYIVYRVISKGLEVLESIIMDTRASASSRLKAIQLLEVFEGGKAVPEKPRAEKFEAGAYEAALMGRDSGGA